MASRFAIERQLNRDRGGPSADHSQNNAALKGILHHERHFEVPRKLAYAERRRVRREKLQDEYNNMRLTRIKARAEHALSGYGGYIQEVLTVELRYLERNGIRVTRATAATTSNSRLALVDL